MWGRKEGVVGGKREGEGDTLHYLVESNLPEPKVGKHEEEANPHPLKHPTEFPFLAGFHIKPRCNGRRRRWGWGGGSESGLSNIQLKCCKLALHHTAVARCRCMSTVVCT